MRLIKTFILRFYTDSDQSEQFCGDLRAIPGHKTLAFKNSSGLLTLLLRLVKMDANQECKPALPDEIDGDI